MKDKRFNCTICSTAKKIKNNEFIHRCNNRICVDCVLKNIFEYGKPKCPYCRLPIIDDMFLSTGGKVNKIKEYTRGMYKSLWKLKSKDEVLKVIRIVAEILRDKEMTGNLIKFIPNYVNLFVKTLKDNKPFLLAVQDKGNIILTNDKYLNNFLNNNSFPKLCKVYNISSIGIFVDDKSDEISLMDFNDPHDLEFKETSRLYSNQNAILKEKLQIEVQEDNILKKEVIAGSLDDIIRILEGYIISIEVIDEKQSIYEEYPGLEHLEIRRVEIDTRNVSEKLDFNGCSLIEINNMCRDLYLKTLFNGEYITECDHYILIDSLPDPVTIGTSKFRMIMDAVFANCCKYHECNFKLIVAVMTKWSAICVDPRTRKSMQEELFNTMYMAENSE